MNDEKKIKDAETESADASDKSMIEAYFGKLKKVISAELLMIMIIGFLFGIAIKNEAIKRINVTDKSFYGKQSYDFAEMKRNLDEKSKNQPQNQGVPGGNSCAQ